MTSTSTATGRGGNVLCVLAPAVAPVVAPAVAPPVKPSSGGAPPEEGVRDDGGGGDRERHRILVLLGVYTRAKLDERRGRSPRKVSLRRVREVSGLPAVYVEDLVAELVAEGYLEYEPDTRPGVLKSLGRGVREQALEKTFVSLTESGFRYPGLADAYEMLLASRQPREEVVHHLASPQRFMEDLRSEDAERRDYAWSMAVSLGMCALVSLIGSVALVVEIII